MSFLIPPDVSVKGDWNKPEILDELKDSGITLEPIQAQALHVMGLLFLNFESAGHSLCFDCRLAANYYLQSYLLACTAIELLGRCKNGKNHRDPQVNLKRGIDEVGLSTVPTNGQLPDGTYHTYTTDDLVALRNLAAHGQAVATVQRKHRDVILHIELLDSFPQKLLSAFAEFYEDLRNNKSDRVLLADSGVEPVHYYYSGSGHAFLSPIKFAFRILKQHYEDSKDLETLLRYIDWQVYK